MNKQKEIAREIAQTRLRALSEDEYTTASHGIVKTLVTFFKDQSDFSSILLYTPVKKWSEVDVTSLLEHFPNFKFDVVENTKNAPFPEKQYDVVLVPLVGFNKQGFRLGHGGGWYDRFLATQSTTLKIGVGWEDSLVDFTPERHDIPMDIVVTEKQIRDFRVC